ncbi:MAG: MORN repeat protein [Syntrophorhabdus sp. PtaB.Bin047]|nr:MAG: MORN repeat protein [Syntrophorhabdus sp. PtaB.Bin047]
MPVAAEVRLGDVLKRSGQYSQDLRIQGRRSEFLNFFRMSPWLPVYDLERPARIEQVRFKHLFAVAGEMAYHKQSMEIGLFSREEYLGAFVNGKFQGKGTFVTGKDNRYSGDFANDLPNGKGTFVCPNGRQFTGDFKNGIPDGFYVQCD